jgi:hypothetical protein
MLNGLSIVYFSLFHEELHTPSPLPSFFRTKDHVLDLTSPIKKSKMVEGKHGGQRDGKRGKRE